MIFENESKEGSFLEFLERVRGIEPLSSAWKAEVMSRYTTPAHYKSFFAKQI